MSNWFFQTPDDTKITVVQEIYDDPLFYFNGTDNIDVSKNTTANDLEDFVNSSVGFGIPGSNSYPMMTTVINIPPGYTRLYTFYEPVYYSRWMPAFSGIEEFENFDVMMLEGADTKWQYIFLYCKPYFSSNTNGYSNYVNSGKEATPPYKQNDIFAEVVEGKNEIGIIILTENNSIVNPLTLSNKDIFIRQKEQVQNAAVQVGSNGTVISSSAGYESFTVKYGTPLIHQF